MRAVQATRDPANGSCDHQHVQLQTLREQCQGSDDPRRQHLGIMGIRAVQAGALTDAFDREIPGDHPERLDYQRSAPFRALARELDESPASLAHRYALSLAGVATVVLGVKNRTELRECSLAEARGVLAPELMARIDTAVGRA